jgi:hypothetical protein
VRGSLKVHACSLIFLQNFAKFDVNEGLFVHKNRSLIFVINCLSKGMHLILNHLQLFFEFDLLFLLLLELLLHFSVQDVSHMPVVAGSKLRLEVSNKLDLGDEFITHLPLFLIEPVKFNQFMRELLKDFSCLHLYLSLIFVHFVAKALLHRLQRPRVV